MTLSWVYHSFAAASALVMGAYAALFGFYLVTAGPAALFGDPSRNFWLMQAALFLAALATAVPPRRWLTWLAIPRLVLTLALLGTFFVAASVTGGFQY